MKVNEYSVSVPFHTEKRIVLSVSRFPLRQENASYVRTALMNRVDWNEILNFARDWQLEPVAFSNLRSHFSDTIPPETLAEAALRERDARAFVLARTLNVIEIYSQLTEAGIDTLVLKGPAISLMGYGDVSLRTFGDIDLLVNRKDLPRARDILLSKGFTREYPTVAEASLVSAQHALEFVRGSTKVELHCALFSRHLHLNFDLQELWDEAVWLRCLTTDIRVLSPTHLFLLVCAHGAKHEWAGMRWICDVAQLADRLGQDEVEAVVSIAKRTNSLRLLSLAAGIACDIFGAPDRFEGRLDSSKKVTKPIIERVLYNLGLQATAPVSFVDRISRIDKRIGPILFWVQARERWADRILVVWRAVFVPAHADSPWRRLQWVIRPVRLFLIMIGRGRAG